MNAAWPAALLASGAVMARILRRRPQRRSASRSAREIVQLQLDALLTGDISVAYKLASPANRANTAAPSGYNTARFFKMVRTSFPHMLDADRYELFDAVERPGVVIALLFRGTRLLIGYEFSLSRQTVEDMHESMRPYELARNSGAWRTDRVRPLSTFEARQLQFRKLCFGDAWNRSKLSHSFGVDATHNLCCQLGPKARRLSDREGNLRGDPSRDVTPTTDGFTRWSTCMGSNVCGDYATRAGDGTRPLFATSRDLTQVAIDIAPTRDCEARAARLLSVASHGTPGIKTAGNPARCSQPPRILKTPAQIDAWLASPSPDGRLRL